MWGLRRVLPPPHEMPWPRAHHTCDLAPPTTVNSRRGRRVVSLAGEVGHLRWAFGLRRTGTAHALPWVRLAKEVPFPSRRLPSPYLAVKCPPISDIPITPPPTTHTHTYTHAPAQAGNRPGEPAAVPPPSPPALSSCAFFSSSRFQAFEMNSAYCLLGSKGRWPMAPTISSWLIVSLSSSISATAVTSGFFSRISCSVRS
mmetsp:Transcript_36573/g.97785  ORF Transcript_36573/g.97785 Transcript_36573/m.97785 type:complete len:200 (-) Transcript_36573:1942-2541(-)